MQQERNAVPQSIWKIQRNFIKRKMFTYTEQVESHFGKGPVWRNGFWSRLGRFTVRVQSSGPVSFCPDILFLAFNHFQFITFDHAKLFQCTAFLLRQSSSIIIIFFFSIQIGVFIWCIIIIQQSWPPNSWDNIRVSSILRVCISSLHEFVLAKNLWNWMMNQFELTIYAKAPKYEFEWINSSMAYSGLI